MELLDAVFPPSFDGCHPNFSQAAFFVIGMEMEVDSTFDLGSEQKAQEARAFLNISMDWVRATGGEGGIGGGRIDDDACRMFYLGHLLRGGFALMAESI